MQHYYTTCEPKYELACTAAENSSRGCNGAVAGLYENATLSTPLLPCATIRKVLLLVCCGHYGALMLARRCRT